MLEDDSKKTNRFILGERVVYPSHGVGEIIDIETQTIAGMCMEVYVILFSQDKMTLRVPVTRAEASGLRTLINKTAVEEVYNILRSKPKRGNKMWSRRAQEFEVKINSGDIALVAEVVRDLYKNVDADRSYSERTIYEAALSRLASEIAALESIPEKDIANKIVDVLKEKLIAA